MIEMDGTIPPEAAAPAAPAGRRTRWVATAAVAALAVGAGAFGFVVLSTGDGADSPEAAARIIALTLLADGHVGAVELATLEQVGACDQLGLDRQAMHAVLQVFCEDLQLAREGQWADACRIDPRTLASLMAEVESPVLRTTVLRLCVAVVEADDHVTDGESIVLVAAVEQWGLHREMLRVASVDLNAT